jgi:shikimate kinase
MNLVLIGYRGSGKSTIGRILAGQLELQYVGLDDEIVRRAGMPIPEIVSRHSWDHFRNLEQQVVEDVTGRDQQILDTGGGVIMRPENTVRLRQGGVVFLLETTVEDIVRRIGADTQRPSLTGAKSFTDEVADVLRDRNPLYRGAAHHTIHTSVLDPQAAADRIAALFVAQRDGGVAGPR